MKKSTFIHIVITLFILFLLEPFTMNASETNRYAILFIHGLAGNHTAWDELMNNLPNDDFQYMGNISITDKNYKKAIFSSISNLNYKINKKSKFLCYTMDLSDNQNLMFDGQGDEVALAIKKIKNLTNVKKVILIGHSMGGLSARAYINKYGVKNVAGYVSISTPHLGSYLGEVQNIYYDIRTPSIIKRNIRTIFLLTRFTMALKLKSKVIKELSPCSYSLMQLNSVEFPTTVPIDIVISDYKLNKIPQSVYNDVYKYISNHKNCHPTIDIMSQKVQSRFGDIIVPVVSQDIRLAVPNGAKLNSGYFFSDKFHTEVEKDLPVMHKMLLDITKKAEETKQKKKRFIALILDSSGSMKENDPNQARIKTAQKIISMLSSDERVFIIDFDDKARWVNENNYENWEREKLISEINTIDSEGGTDIGISLLAAKKALLSSGSENMTGGVILFTDGKGAYTNEANWFQKRNIPIYTISFTEHGDALLLSKIAAITGGQYLLAKNESEAINALDFFFYQIFDFSLFFSQRDIIYANTTKTYKFNVDKNIKKLLVSVGWYHSTIDLSLISPSGKIYSEASIQNDYSQNNHFFKSDNFVSYKIPNAEGGLWTAKIYGRSIPPSGERFVFNASGDSPYFIDLNTTVDSVSGLINFRFNGINNNATIDLLAITPENDTIKVINKKVKNYLKFLPAFGKGSYNFKINLSSKVAGTSIERQYFRTIIIGDNVSSNNGIIKKVLGTYVTISIGEWAGNFPGITCYFYNLSNEMVARGKVIGVKSDYSIVQVNQYYKGYNSDQLKPGNPVQLDYKQWLNDK